MNIWVFFDLLSLSFSLSPLLLSLSLPFSLLAIRFTITISDFLCFLLPTPNRHWRRHKNTFGGNGNDCDHSSAIFYSLHKCISMFIFQSCWTSGKFFPSKAQHCLGFCWMEWTWNVPMPGARQLWPGNICSQHQPIDISPLVFIKTMVFLVFFHIHVPKKLVPQISPNQLNPNFQGKSSSNSACFIHVQVFYFLSLVLDILPIFFCLALLHCWGQ